MGGMGGTGYSPMLINQIETIVQKHYPRASHNTISRGRNMGCCKKDDDDIVKDALVLGTILHLGSDMDDMGDNDTFDDGGIDA